VFRGFEGLPTSALGDLEFWWRDDGHCGAGAPRFNVRIEPISGPAYTFFVGCAAMIPGGTEAGPDGTTYEQRTFAGELIPPGTVAGLAIVFDEGEEFQPGHVYLDNIRVGDWVWTSASDNGGGNTAVDATTLEAMWGAPLETLLMP
jgi:hypothetical protein